MSSCASTAMAPWTWVDLPGHQPWPQARGGPSRPLPLASDAGWLLSDALSVPAVAATCAEYIMRNAGLEEIQAGIKIARRNINNHRYADDTILMAENEEELKSLLMKVKEESEKLA